MAAYLILRKGSQKNIIHYTVKNDFIMNFQSLFLESKGDKIIYQGKFLKLADRINLSEVKIKLRLTFIKSDSKWQQGIFLSTKKGKIHIAGKTYSKKVLIMDDSISEEEEITVEAKDKILFVYNAWKDENDKVLYWEKGAAMYIEEYENSKIYYCNDGLPDDDFNDLIFKIEFLT